jgi:hyperosmotically inducible periplasmic protein
VKAHWILALTLAAVPLTAQEAAPAPGAEQNQQSIIRMAKAIRKQIVTLPNYGVFDDINFSINNNVVTLTGSVSRPTLKNSAEDVVKKVEGVRQVVNKLQVQPQSSMDDNIRRRVYAAVYGTPSLSRYNPNRGIPAFRSPASFAGGVTNDPPPGFHPIHIIVNNGHVTLTGVVDNEGDKSIAGIKANGVSGVFSVDNELRVASEAKVQK